jgi:hypothetical protein
VARLKWTDISFKNSTFVKCLKVKLLRMKTGGEQTLGVVLHHHSWAVCPFHALGTMIICNNPVSRGMFENVPIKGEAKYMNRILRVLYDQWDDDLERDDDDPHDFLLYTSHSQRHGSAETGNEHPDIQTQWLIPRGAWTLDQIQTIFNYIAGTAKSDTYVARAVAGWPSAESGGQCPG